MAAPHPTPQKEISLDCRGLYCPIPVIRVAQTIKKFAVGDIIELLADDPGVEGDMKAWSRGTGHELMSIERESGGLFRFRVRKALGRGDSRLVSI